MSTKTPSKEGPAVAAGQRTRAKRVTSGLFCKVHGRLGASKAMAVNLSRTGALLAITDSKFQVSEQEAEMGLLGLRIASHFGESIRIEILGADIVLQAEVARVTDGMQGDTRAVYLGCRFRPSLTPELCDQLDVPMAEEVPAPALQAAGALQGQVVVVNATGADLRAQPAAEPAPYFPKHIRLAPDQPEMGIVDLLALTVEKKASDLHLKAGSPVRIRTSGMLRTLGKHVLTPDEAEGLIRDLLDEDQFKRFAETGDLDMAYSLAGKARFRVNVLRSKGLMGMAIRRIPEEIPTIEELGLASVCVELADRPRGLVLVTGPTGSGKSTTLAAMLHHVNKTRACHIVTMEDPIEYVHAEKQAHITQREIGRDTQDFASALKRSLRQDPDVILVGEMRDLETVALAVTAAETGHLVFATLHTTSAVLTVDRVVDVFPSAQQRQIRMQMADALQGIVSQVMMPRKNGGVVVAQEILIATGAVRALVREGKTPQIGNMMQTGAKSGMQTLEDGLNDLLSRGVITYETALAKANHPHQIKEGGVPLTKRQREAD